MSEEIPSQGTQPIAEVRQVDLSEQPCVLRPGIAMRVHGRTIQLRRLPGSYVIPTKLLPIATGHVTFIRLATAHGHIHLLSQTFWFGKRLKGQYVKAALDTAHGSLTIYVRGCIFKCWPYRFLTK